MIWIYISVVVWIISIIKVIVDTVRMKYTSTVFVRGYNINNGRGKHVTVRDYSMIYATVLVGFVAGLIFCIFANIISARFVDTTPRVKATYTLYNLADSNSTAGRLLLGSGTIENAPVFSYYTDGKGGGYVLSWKPSAQSSVFEDNNPRMEVIEYVFEDSIWFIGGSKKENHYNFYVPRGSVKPVYNLDAQ